MLNREIPLEHEEPMSRKSKVRIDVGKETPDPEISKADTERITAESAAPVSSVEELEQKLAAAESEAKESYDKFLRASAELENYKKRTQKELADFRKFANESLIKELLNVADNLERAIEMPKDGSDETQLVEGVDLTLKELLKVFQKFDVHPIVSLGEPFDPAFHQAMMQQEVKDQPDNIVIQELQKGYIIHDRLLRPAMVVVSKTDNKDAGKGAEDTTKK
jgi:molecular chaperone GrpE